MADNKWTVNVATSGGFGGLNQNLNTGLMEDGDGKPVIPEVVVPKGATVISTNQDGVFRRTVFSTGAVEVVQTLPSVPGDGLTIAAAVKPSK